MPFINANTRVWNTQIHVYGIHKHEYTYTEYTNTNTQTRVYMEYINVCVYGIHKLMCT